jgi:uncharacterized iron-regulated membrane protein
VELLRHNLLRTILHHPRKLWVRRALFQIHLWLGVLLSLYVIVIGLTGSILVFEDEIRHLALRNISFDDAHIASVSTVIDQTHSSFPDWKLSFVSPPQKQNPMWTLYLVNAHGKDKTVYADAASGAPLAHRGKLFIDYVLDLHVNLFMGRTGFIVNCIAGMGLLVLAISGLVLWWPGIKLWTRGFFISFGRKWKRINYDAHNAVGIWMLLIISWWGITAVYFLLPAKVSAVVNVVSPLVGMKEPQAVAPQDTSAVASIEEIIATQKQISPGYLNTIKLPEKPGGNVILYVDRTSPGDFTHRDIDTFNGHTGKLLTVWHYGENKSLGDWFLWLMYPLHFGTLWGLPIKVLWAIFGLSLPVLSFTGLLMYWNRFLSKRWHSTTANNQVSPKDAMSPSYDLP